MALLTLLYSAHGSDKGSARFLPHRSILFLYLDEEVYLIKELFLGYLLSKE